MILKKMSFLLTFAFFINTFHSFSITIDLNLEKMEKLAIILSVPVLGIIANNNVENSEHISTFLSALPSGTLLALFNKYIENSTDNLTLKALKNTLTLYAFSYCNKNELVDNFWENIGRYVGIVNATFVGDLSKYLLLYKLTDAKSKSEIIGNSAAALGFILLLYANIISNHEERSRKIKEFLTRNCFLSSFMRN